MGQTLSPESICTTAMLLLKRNPVISMSDNTDEALKCSIVFAPLRDQLLELYAWTFATERVQLQRSAIPPIYQYLYSYPLPEDCLMPLEARADIFDDSGAPPPVTGIPDGHGMEFTWLVEGQNIVTNAVSVFLKYSRQVIETGLFTPSFATALSYRIAAMLAYPMTGNEKLAATWTQMSDQEAKRAESRDAQKGTEEKFIQEDSWVRSRNSRFMRYNRAGFWQGPTE